MLEELKKRSVRQVMPCVLILLVLGIGLLIYFGPKCFLLVRGPVKFEDLSIDELEGQYVTATYELTFGMFAEEITTETSRYGSSSEYSSNQYYLMLVGGLDRYLYSEDYFEFVGVEFPKHYYSQADEVYNDSADFFTDDMSTLDVLDSGFTITGQIVPLTGELLGYYRDYAEQLDYTEEEFNQYFAPYCLRVDKIGGMPYSIIALCTLGGVVLVVIAAVMLIRAQTGSYQKKLVNSLKAIGGDMEVERASNDYNTAQELVKGVRLGRLYLFNNLTAKSQAIPYKAIVWAYSSDTKHKRYGVTTGTTYSADMYLEDKSFHSIPLNKDARDKLIRFLAENVPGAIVGYSKELASLYQKDYTKFLQLRGEKAAQNTAGGSLEP